jgi:hypothetical protein
MAESHLKNNKNQENKTSGASPAHRKAPWHPEKRELLRSYKPGPAED